MPRLNFTSSLFLSSTSSFFLASLLALYALQSPSQPKRWAILPVFFLLTTSAFSGINHLPLPPELGLIAGLGIGQFLIVWFANILQLLLIEKYDVPLADINRPWMSAYKVLYNSRRILKNLNEPVRGVEKMTRTQFSQAQCLKITTAISITALISNLTEPLVNLLLNHFTHPTAPLLEQRSFIHRFNQVNTFEAILRSISLIEFVAGSWAMCTFFHSIFSLFFVYVLQIDEPDEWPVLFGSLTETYSIRRFWGKFWHRLVSSIWLELAKSVVSVSSMKKREEDAPLSRGSLDRLMVTGLVFLFSGVDHGFVAWSQGFTCGWWEEISIYLLNFCAIMTEDLVKRKFQGMGGQRILSSRMQRVVGYCWTWGFLFWCVPKVQYTKSLCLPRR